MALGHSASDALSRPISCHSQSVPSSIPDTASYEDRVDRIGPLDQRSRNQANRVVGRLILGRLRRSVGDPVERVGVWTRAPGRTALQRGQGRDVLGRELESEHIEVLPHPCR